METLLIERRKCSTHLCINRADNTVIFVHEEKSLNLIAQNGLITSTYGSMRMAADLYCNFWGGGRGGEGFMLH